MKAYLLILSEVKQTVNTPIVIAIIVNKATIKTRLFFGFMRKQKQTLFLSKIICYNKIDIFKKKYYTVVLKSRSIIPFEVV
jgi:hypothetical protein